MKRIYFLLILLGSLWSCENEALLYQGETNGKAGIYFFCPKQVSIGGTILSYIDSIEYSFVDSKLEDTAHQVAVPVKILGELADYDRSFQVKIAGGTAVEGKDFEPLKELYWVKANQVDGSVYVVLKRTPKLEEKAVNIVLELVENEYFDLLLPYLNNVSTKDTLDTRKFKVSFSDIIPMPGYYERQGKSSFFGEWSVKKFRMINEVLGWTYNDWLNAGFSGSKVTRGKFAFVASRLQAILQAAADANEPILENDGSFMQLVKDYVVDYSHVSIEKQTILKN